MTPPTGARRDACLFRCRLSSFYESAVPELETAVRKRSFEEER